MDRENGLSVDIFCTVVDNYGDIGVCWRLARQLANEHGASVRLWVDDLASFHKLYPRIVVGQAIQQQQGVEVRYWGIPFDVVAPAQLVIEAFACELPESYVQSMAELEHKPVWVNLEYLSAEDWVAGCHGLPSPHLRLPLVKYFFFPGFTKETGGLLLEQDLLSRRDAFLSSPTVQENFWMKLGVPPRIPAEVRVSLFCYETPAISTLLGAWEKGGQATTCLAPEGRVVPQIAAFLGRSQLVAGDVVQQGSLRVHVLPFVEQDDYDKLLWACDCNFVRGEDSCVRAQWAAKPFVWHIYPQQDGVHIKKLHALLALYSTGLEPESSLALAKMWDGMNIADELVLHPATDPGQVWRVFQLQLPALTQHANNWARQLTANNLALNLLDFSRKVGRIAPFEI